MNTIHAVIKVLEAIAPPVYQEGYDNAGLIVGDPGWEVTGVLTCLDATEAIVDEAVRRGCNLVVAHHPIVFKGLKRITGANYVERTVIKAIKSDVAIYAIHTNLDNVYHRGVNTRMAGRLGLERIAILAPKKVVRKLVSYAPLTASERLKAVLEAAGGRQVTTFPEGGPLLPAEEEKSGNIDARLVRLEVVYDLGREHALLHALREAHPFEDPACELIDLAGPSPEVGSGMVGYLPAPMDARDFLLLLRERFELRVIRHTDLPQGLISKVALCGGAGSFLLPAAIRSGADVFITGDYKYHEFFDADGKILIADIGHFESEQYTIGLLAEIISEKFPTFAVCSTGVNTNPVRYFLA